MTTKEEPMSKTLEELDAAAQRAHQVAAAARDAADQARAEAEQRRQTRLAAYDRERREEYDPDQLAQDTADAQRRLTEAVMADPVWKAVIAVGVAQRRQIHSWREAGSVGVSPLPSGANKLDPEYLASVADRAAGVEMEDELDAGAAAREAAGDGP